MSQARGDGKEPATEDTGKALEAERRAGRTERGQGGRGPARGGEEGALPARLARAEPHRAFEVTVRLRGAPSGFY